jgi:lactoylglutathione lyase
VEVDIKTRRVPLQVSTTIFLVALTAAVYAQTAPERPPITGVANIAIRVQNLDAARQFYSGIVGLTEAFEAAQAGEPSPRASFKVNDRQYVEVSPELKSETEDRLISIGFETMDARKLRDYLAAKRIKVPAKILPDPNGNLSFSVKDPDGHSVQFVQYMPGSIHSRNFGKHVSHKRISDHILHVGIRVSDPGRADAFYKDVLGFRLMWKGGRTDTHFDWISMLVPDGDDWVEYMVTDADPTPQQLGVLHHYCLSTLDIQNVYKTVVERGYNPPKPPNIARDGRWLLQLYDSDYTRTELMVRKPVQTPCCSPMTDDH